MASFDPPRISEPSLFREKGVRLRLSIPGDLAGFLRSTARTPAICSRRASCKGNELLAIPRAPSVAGAVVGAVAVVEALVADGTVVVAATGAGHVLTLLWACSGPVLGLIWACPGPSVGLS